MKTLSAQEWMQTTIIWFLELEYDGDTFRFSSESMDLSDNDGFSYQYIGGLEDVSITQSIGVLGIVSTQDESISLAVTFPNRNISKELYNGKVLSGNNAQIGFVLVRDGAIVQSFEERQIVYSGILVEPVYGYPDNPLGYVEFSIENPSNITEQPLLRVLLGENLYIEDVSMSPNPQIGQTTPFPNTNNIVNVSDIHRGKTIPFVFGELDNVLRENNSSADIPISPAYVISYEPTGTKPCFYVIAGHLTNAVSVRAFNNLGDVVNVNSVSSFVNIDNRVFSYIEISGDVHSWSNSVSQNNDRQVWVQWNNGAPHPNPFENGDLKGGGDITLFMLQQITNKIDYQAWGAIRSILNEYTFGGYINDDKITIFQWLQKNIIAYLPISIVNGPKGLKPVLDLYLEGGNITPRLTIEAGLEWFRNGPIITQSTSDDIINQVMVRYAINGVTNTPTARISISNSKSPTPMLGFGLNPLCEISKSIFGTKRRVIDLEYCYDWKTATKIANNIITTNAMPTKTIQYSVPLKYGYLEIGDIIELSDVDLGFSGLKVQLLSKQYNENRWVMDFKMDSNPLRRNKTDV
tara:strand:+ start:3517 stop:5247 length:1731 start_codon:yes stop_codon:yes gene_type:complete